MYEKGEAQINDMRVNRKSVAAELFCDIVPLLFVLLLSIALTLSTGQKAEIAINTTDHIESLRHELDGAKVWLDILGVELEIKALSEHLGLEYEFRLHTADIVEYRRSLDGVFR